MSLPAAPSVWREDGRPRIVDFRNPSCARAYINTGIFFLHCQRSYVVFLCYKHLMYTLYYCERDCRRKLVLSFCVMPDRGVLRDCKTQVDTQ